MSLFSLIKKRGFSYAVSAIAGSANCQAFELREKILNKAKDEVSYSQHSEDLFIDRKLKYKKNGFYIDIGANSPEVLNNTKRFYERGWSGVNVEPNYSLWQKFVDQRTRDLNLNVGVGEEGSEFEFYIFEHDTLSTFSKAEAESLLANGETLTSKISIQVMTLSEIFKKINRSYVDFISIDTEGWDEKVLRSNDWTINRAEIICIENNKSADLVDFMKNISYKKIANNSLNDFYVDLLKK